VRGARSRDLLARVLVHADTIHRDHGDWPYMAE